MTDQEKRNHRNIVHIVENYEKLEASIVTQIKMATEHGGVIGSFREEVWLSLFERIIPKKFSIARSVFIMDSHGRVSKEVDLAIFDEQYTPYIFNYGVIKFIPIEAVSVVVQCKSKTLTGVEDWAQSIDDLQTSMKSIARQFTHFATGEFECELDGEQLDAGNRTRTTQTATRPIKVLCSTDYLPNLISGFDLTICPGRDAPKLWIRWLHEAQVLSKWASSLNHANQKYSGLAAEGASSFKYGGQLTLSDYRVNRNANGEREAADEVSLLSLTFQLNQLLMLINNPLLFPHLAYVEMFNKELEKESGKG